MNFPPFFFVHYSDDKQLKYGDRLNQNHRFSNWFLKNSNDLKKKYPGIYSSFSIELQKTFNDYFLNESDAIKLSHEIQNNINSLLQRLIDLEKKGELSPSRAIFLTEDDIDLCSGILPELRKKTTESA